MKAYLLILFFCKYLALVHTQMVSYMTRMLRFKCQILGFIRMMLQNLKAMQHGLNAKYLALFTQMEVWFMLAILCLNAKYLALFQNIFFIYFRIFIV